jgi:osmotically inducible protein OsmC
MKRKASASWTGGLKDGSGTVSADSGIFKGVAYNAPNRFEKVSGTSPEELIAAAHASCFVMALSGELGKVGLTAERLDATATVTVEPAPTGGFSVTESHLDLTAKIPNGDPAKFEQATEAARKGCPISKLLNAKITLEARLA